VHFARRREEIQLLDRALNAFLRQAAGGRPTGERSADDARQAQGDLELGRQLSVLQEEDVGEPGEELPVKSASRLETLRHKDFESLTDEEMREVRDLIRSMPIPTGRRLSRRFRRGGDERLDLRRLLRSSLRLGGEPLKLSFRRRRIVPRPLVLLCDISGSMERYARVLLNFAYAIENAAEHVEAFVFATRLTRITRQLRSHDPDAALNRVSRAVDDWSGGTRIGEALSAFNHRYARRVLAQGATVVLISDGWDRGDPQGLQSAVRKLQRSCHRLIWMNPLLGAPGYEPLTVGLKSALPYVDDFIAAHNLASLEALGRLIAAAGDHRPVRRQVGNALAATSSTNPAAGH
jgi:uncharacterized protein with von Willebrand factor type A (vWA) domain